MKLTHLVDKLEARSKKEGLPSISVGDTVKIGVLIQEGEKTRVQPYQGIVIARHRASLHTTITVRRVFQGIGVERIFTIHSPALKESKFSDEPRFEEQNYIIYEIGSAKQLD